MDNLESRIKGIVSQANVPVAPQNVNTSVNQNPVSAAPIASNNAAAIAAINGLVAAGIMTRQVADAAIAGMSVNQTMPATHAPIGRVLCESAKRPELQEFIRDDPVMGKVMHVSYNLVNPGTKDEYSFYKFFMTPFSVYNGVDGKKAEPFGGSGWTINDTLYVEALLTAPPQDRAIIDAELLKFNRNPTIVSTSKLGKKVAKGTLKF